MPVTGVIFDCDGTLLDSMEAWLFAEAELAKRAGKELTQADRDIITTLTIPETGAYYHTHFGLGSNAQEVVGMIEEIMLAFYAGHSKPRPGALEFVRAIFGLDVKCSVASSTPQALLQVGLAKTGFAPYLSAIVSVDDVGKSKREPAVYDRARELMGTAKESTWVFEDAVYALRTLREAGYHSVGVYDRDEAGTREELCIADIMIDNFEELDPKKFVLC